MTVGQITEQMTAREISEWAAYEQVSGPLGDERMDTLLSYVAYMVAKQGGSKKPFRDFVWKWPQPRRRSESAVAEAIAQWKKGAGHG